MFYWTMPFSYKVSYPRFSSITKNYYCATIMNDVVYRKTAYIFNKIYFNISWILTHNKNGRILICRNCLMKNYQWQNSCESLFTPIFQHYDTNMLSITQNVTEIFIVNEQKRRILYILLKLQVQNVSYILLCCVVSEKLFNLFG